MHFKERRKLILVPREMPLSITMLDNMRQASQCGAIIMPAMPGFYHGVKSIRDLVDEHHAHVSVIGIWLTAIGLMLMPLLGWANHKLGAALGSEATAGEGTQNYLCALQAAGVLTGLALTATWTGGWWVDPTRFVREHMIDVVQERLPGSDLAERAGIELADYYFRIRDLRQITRAHGAVARLVLFPGLEPAEELAEAKNEAPEPVHDVFPSTIISSNFR